LGWFRVTTRLPQLAINRVALRFPKIPRLVTSSDVAERQSQPLERTGMMMIMILLLGIIVFTHQLTPLMNIFALTALVLFRRLSARTLPILVTILTLTWISYMTMAFFRDNVGTIIETFGQLSSNVDSNLIDISQASPGQALVAFMSRGLTAFLIGLALCGGIRRLLGGYWDLAPILLVIAPITWLGLNSYEGEIGFRVYLFALPFMAFFVAASVYPTSTSGTSIRTATITVLLSSMLLSGFFFAYYGKERQNHFTRNEFEAVQYLYNTAPKGSLLIEGVQDYPSRFQNYEIFTHVTIANEPKAEKLKLLEHPVDTFSQWMSNDKYAAAYLVITRSQKAGTDALGLMPPAH
jgi:hypothetical protein